MLDINLIREKPELVRTALKNRQLEPSPVDDILRLDEKRRALLTEVERLKAERNAVSKEIGKMKDAAEREQKIAAMREVCAPGALALISVLREDGGLSSKGIEYE